MKSETQKKFAQFDALLKKGHKKTAALKEVGLSTGCYYKHRGDRAAPVRNKLIRVKTHDATPLASRMIALVGSPADVLAAIRELS